MVVTAVMVRAEADEYYLWLFCSGVSFHMIVMVVEMLVVVVKELGTCNKLK